jgi:hypothetical protein
LNETLPYPLVVIFPAHPQHSPGLPLAIMGQNFATTLGRATASFTVFPGGGGFLFRPLLAKPSEELCPF